MTRLSILLFGPLQVTLDGEPVTGFESDKVRALLAYLAIESDVPQQRERLAGLLWPEYPEQTARTNLRHVLANLRTAIGDRTANPPFLHVTRHTIQFNRAREVQVDVLAFQDFLSGAHHPSLSLPASDPQTLRRLEDAVNLYRSNFLEGFSLAGCPDFEEWMLFQGEHLRRRVLETLECLSDQYEKKGQFELALKYAWRQVELDPWRESGHQQAMRLLAQSGKRAAALAQYGVCCRALEEGLGVKPEEKTTQIYEQIRDGRWKTWATLVETRKPDLVLKPPTFLDDAQEHYQPPLCVAREGELAWLDRHLEQAICDQGQVVFVIGGPGRGKTLLLEAFAQRAMETYPDLLVASGRCNAYLGRGDPYLPFREIMFMLTAEVETRWASGTIGRDHARRLWAALPQVAQVVLEHGPHMIPTLVSGQALLSRVGAAAVGNLPWLESLRERVGRQQLQARRLEQSYLFQQVTQVMQNLAKAHPLLLILDDLQWSDISSTSLLFHLGRELAQRGGRILIACAYRPEEVSQGELLIPEPRSGPADRHPLEKVLNEFKRTFGDVWLDLGAVTKSEGRHFVDAFLDTEPNCLGEGFRKTLFEHTAGHPLFTIEMLKVMQERGDLIQDDLGRWLEGSTLNWQTLPARVEGVIEERISQLGDESRWILSVASVEGEMFTTTVLAQIVGKDEYQLLHELSRNLGRRHRLVREQDIITTGQHSLTRFQFTHALYQQYLYDHLGPGERLLLHRKIARTLETLYEGHTEKIAARLAHHYAGDTERESHYVRLAGEQAAARYATEEVVQHLSRALMLTPETSLVERYDLLLAREEALHILGARDTQSQDLESLSKLAEAIDGSCDLIPGMPQKASCRAEVALRRSRCAWETSDYPAASAAARLAIELAQIAEDRKNEAAGHYYCGRSLLWQSQYGEAKSHLEHALSLSQAVGSRQMEADSLRALGIAYYFSGDYTECIAYNKLALAFHREIGDRMGEGDALNNLGFASSDQGDYRAALDYLDQALRTKRQIGDRPGEAVTLINLGLVYQYTGVYAKAQTCYEQSLSITQTIGYRWQEGNTLSNLALLFHQMSDDEAALQYSQQSLEIIDELGEASRKGKALLHLGHALMGLGRLKEAAKAYHNALDTRRSLKQSHLATEPLAGLARLALTERDHSKALAYVEEILSHLEKGNLDGTKEPFRVYLTCYQVLRAHKDSRAGEFLATTYHLLQERAVKIDDQELRRSFLENVAAHRQIVSEWKAKA